MPLTINFRAGIDVPDWRVLRPALNASAVGGSLCADLRNSDVRIPLVYHTVSNVLQNRYNIKKDGWGLIAVPSLAGTFGAGAITIFCPYKGPRGTLAAGGTQTSVVLSTSLVVAVSTNSLANRGDGVGYTIRIIGNAAGSSGKTEERKIISNTASITPTITLDSALSFTPIAGDGYEILSGSVMMLGAGTLAAGSWKAFDVASCEEYSNLATTNLPATIGTDSSIVALDEHYVPCGRVPGEGFFGNLISTGTAAGTITGQAAGGDAGVLANEWRNFQIRIVEDITTPTAVGQRRRITSHTVGASPVYTLASNWAVTPTSGATFVIELPNYILRWGETTTTTYTYDVIADSWSTSTFGARGSAVAAGQMAFGSWGLNAVDVTRRAKYSNVFSFRGGASPAIDLLDIAGGANGSWSVLVAIEMGGIAIGAGSCAEYDPVTNNGKYAYIVVGNGNQFWRFDVFSQKVEEWCQLPAGIQGAAVVGSKMAYSVTINDTTKIGKLMYLFNTSTVFMDCIILT